MTAHTVIRGHILKQPAVFEPSAEGIASGEWARQRSSHFHCFSEQTAWCFSLVATNR